MSEGIIKNVIVLEQMVEPFIERSLGDCLLLDLCLSPGVSKGPHNKNKRDFPGLLAQRVNTQLLEGFLEGSLKDVFLSLIEGFLEGTL